MKKQKQTRPFKLDKMVRSCDSAGSERRLVWPAVVAAERVRFFLCADILTPTPTPRCSSLSCTRTTPTAVWTLPPLPRRRALASTFAPQSGPKLVACCRSLIITHEQTLLLALSCPCVCVHSSVVVCVRWMARPNSPERVAWTRASTPSEFIGRADFSE